ncbi:MAG TPA: YceI family protein [Acidimicrobiales bacterium]|nr:YceI family protein [Acidimicrobiales bacterium]
MTQHTSTRPSQQQRTQPVAGVYEIDKSHSMVEFVSRHLMVTKVRGRFSEFSGAITVGQTAAESSVEVTIDAASIDTRDEKRDAHLRSEDFLDVENHPTLEFRSTDVEVVDDERLRVTGDLTIRGVTRPVTLDATFDGEFSDPWGGQRIGFSASTEIDREDWGLTWNVALETGGVLVARKARLELTVSAVRK